MATRTLTVLLAGDASGSTKALEEATGGFSKLGTAAAAAGVAGVAAVTALAVKGVQNFAKLENQLSEVRTLIPDISDEGFGKLRDDVIDFSDEMNVATDKAIPALYQAISAGIPRENALDFLEVASKAAVGGVTELETAVDGITTVMNSFGEAAGSATQVSDQMFTAVRLGKTTFDELSTSLFNVAPLAASANVGFDEITAGLARLTAQGTPTSVATTQLRAAIQGLVAPSTAGAKLLSDLGLSFDEATLAEIGLEGALNKLHEATGGNIEQLKAVIGSVEGVQAVLGLTGPNAEAFASALDEVRNSTGATDAAFETMSNTLSFRWEQTMNRVNNLLTKFGIALLPLVEGALDKLLPLVETFADELSANMGPAIQNISAWVQDTAVPAFQTLASLFQAHVVPALAEVGLILDVVGNGFKRLLEGEFLSAAEWFEDLPVVGDSLVAFAELLNDYLPQAVEMATAAFREISAFMMSDVVPAIQTVVDWLRVHLPPAIETVAGFITGTLIPAYVAYIKFLISDVIPAVRDVVVWLGTNLPPAIEAAAKFVTETLVPAFNDLAAFVASDVIPAVEDIVEWLKENVPPALAATSTFITETLVPAFDDFVAFVASDVIPAVEDIVEWLKENVPPALAATSTFITETLVPAFDDFVAFVASDVIPAVEDIVEWLKENVPPALAATSTFITETLVPAFEAFTAFVASDVIPAVEDIVEWLKENVPPALAATSTFITETLVPAFEAFTAFVASDVIPAVQDVVTWLKDNVPPAVETAAKFFNEEILPAITAVANFVTGTLVPAIVEVNSTVVSLQTKWTEIWTEIQRETINLIEPISNTVQGLINTINSIVGAARSARNTANSILSGIRVPSIAIPGLQHGGIVPATPGGRLVRVAEGGEDEAIVPLSRFARGGGGAGFGGNTYILKVETVGGDPDHIASVLFPALQRLERDGAVARVTT